MKKLAINSIAELVRYAIATGSSKRNRRPDAGLAERRTSGFYLGHAARGAYSTWVLPVEDVDLEYDAIIPRP